MTVLLIWSLSFARLKWIVKIYIIYAPPWVIRTKTELQVLLLITQGFWDVLNIQIKSMMTFAFWGSFTTFNCCVMTAKKSAKRLITFRVNYVMLIKPVTVSTFILWFLEINNTQRYNAALFLTKLCDNFVEKKNWRFDGKCVQKMTSAERFTFLVCSTKMTWTNPFWAAPLCSPAE